jgi:hypothetical protein
MKSSYVPFHDSDRGQHVDVTLHDERSKNGIIDHWQMELGDLDAAASGHTEGSAQ